MTYIFVEEFSPEKSPKCQIACPFLQKTDRKQSNLVNILMVLALDAPK